MAANNATPETARLIITRPAAQAAAFAQALRAAWAPQVEIITAPLLTISALPVTAPAPAGVILSSANGVAAAARLGWPAGLPAWCVGPKTAELAAKAGFAVTQGPGDAAGLIEELTTRRPAGPLLHLRGRHSRGGIASALTKAGLICAELVAYEQNAQPLAAPARAALDDSAPVVLPVFSPRTATLLADAGPFAAPLHLVLISAAAAKATRPLAAASTRIANAPDGDAMLAATLATLSELAG